MLLNFHIQHSAFLSSTWVRPMLLEPESQVRSTMVGIFLWQRYWDSCLNWNCFILPLVTVGKQSSNKMQFQKLDSIGHMDKFQRQHSLFYKTNRTNVFLLCAHGYHAHNHIQVLWGCKVRSFGQPSGRMMQNWVFVLVCKPGALCPLLCFSCSLPHSCWHIPASRSQLLVITANHICQFWDD